MQTPPAGVSPRSSASCSPFKAAAGGVQQSAAALAAAAELLLQQGRVGEAKAALHTALRRCGAYDVESGARIVDLLLEAERELQETPTHSPRHSRHSSDGDGVVAALLRQAQAALAAGELRQAEAALHAAVAAAPPASEARRRAELLLVLCKRHA